jgi:hypothetical protein
MLINFSQKLASHRSKSGDISGEESKAAMNNNSVEMGLAWNIPDENIC